MIENITHFGQFLRSARKERKLTATKLAEKANLAKGTIYSIEKERQEVTLNTAHKLCKALDYEILFNSTQND